MSWPKAILFDLDGTLVDSAADMATALNHVFAEDGFPDLSVADVTRMIGGGIPLLIERALIAHGEEATQERVAAIYPRYRDAYIPRAVEQTRLFPGVADALQLCREKGARLGVCTNKPEEISRVILSRLDADGYFDVVIGGDTLESKKPDPAPVLEGLARLGSEPSNGLMVGDSAADANAAKAAGARAILVTFGYSREPIRSLPNHGIVESFAELPDAIARLAGSPAPA